MRTNSDYFSKGHVLFMCLDVLQLLHSLVLLVGGGGGSGSLVANYSLCRTWFWLRWSLICHIFRQISFTVGSNVFIYLDTTVDLCQGQEW